MYLDHEDPTVLTDIFLLKMSRLYVVAISKFYQAFKATTQKKLIDISKQQNMLTRSFDKYEEFIGIKEVRASQKTVLQAGSEFIVSSRQRREIQSQLSQVQEQLKQVRQKLGEFKKYQLLDI